MIIDSSKQAALLAQMREMAAAARAEAPGVQTDATGASDSGFATVLKQMVDQVDAAQKESAQMASDFATGEPHANLAEAMVAMQKARIHFETMVQVRNRLVTAYEEIMRLPV
ncbi:MAG: flagellar hook-basal body complex protein FliE [Pseudomonadota bacterium]